MILVLMMVFEVSLAIVIGFVLGRIWQIRDDLEQQRDSFISGSSISP
jgi:hypothetical protein